jgi:hypothetical protein
MDFLNKYRQASNDEESESSESKRRNVTIEEDEDDARNYGGEVDDYGYEDEEDEGRFFGGGLTEEQKKILELVDEIDADEVKRIKVFEKCFMFFTTTHTWRFRRRHLMQLLSRNTFFDSKKPSTKIKNSESSILTAQKSSWNQKPTWMRKLRTYLH